MSFRTQQYPSREGHDVIFNTTSIPTIADEVSRLNCSRVYIVISNSALRKHPNYIKQLEETLENAVICGTRVGMTAHTPYDEVIKLATDVVDSEADVLISVGGGSYVDGSKIALLLAASVPTKDLSIDVMQSLSHTSQSPQYQLKSRRVKFIAVPTTLSAAEFQDPAGAMNPVTRQKSMFTHKSAAPDLLIYDPVLCRDTPPRLWLSTGMRAVDHSVETMCSGRATDEQIKEAGEGLRLLVEGMVAYKNGGTEAIDMAQRGAWKSMSGVVAGVMLGGSHGIGHALGSVCGVPHGETSCIMLAPVMKYNMSANSQLQESVRRILQKAIPQLPKHNITDESDAGDMIRALVTELGLPTRLRDVGIELPRDEEKLDRVAEVTLLGIFQKTNPIPLVEKSQVREILEIAL